MQHGDQHHRRVARFLEHLRSSRAVACSSISLIVAHVSGRAKLQGAGALSSIGTKCMHDL